MAIELIPGFKINSTSPIDTRFVLTKDEMKLVKDTSMPDNYFCVCKSVETDPDNGKIFVYKKNNEIDETTGKFRPYVEAIYHKDEFELELKGF